MGQRVWGVCSNYGVAVIVGEAVVLLALGSESGIVGHAAIDGALDVVVIGMQIIGNVGEAHGIHDSQRLVVHAGGAQQLGAVEARVGHEHRVAYAPRHSLLPQTYAVGRVNIKSMVSLVEVHQCVKAPAVVGSSPHGPLKRVELRFFLGQIDIAVGYHLIEFAHQRIGRICRCGYCRQPSRHTKHPWYQIPK